MKHVKCYLPDYPRPQLVRSDWMNLNGEWDFLQTSTAATSAFAGGFSSERKINVPFAVESPLSGIGDKHPEKYLWYCRRVALKGGKVLLHFEGSDYITDVWVNGEYAGRHEGGYARFTFDVSEYVHSGENTFAVRVYDDDSREHPRGKQRWLKDNFGCWYVQTSGIHKPVWLEFVPDVYVRSLRITPSAERGEAAVIVTPSENAEGLTAELTADFAGKRVASCEVPLYIAPNDKMQEEIPVALLKPDAVHLWTAEDPALYDLTVRLKKDGKVIDEVGSYFALRDVACIGPDVCVNGKKIYLKMVLDQGYWLDGHLTPPDEAAILYDVEFIKKAGFNGVRKHQKTEDERFYYYADIIGLYVWCEMPSMYAFDDISRRSFTQTWSEILAQFYNHPAIIAWVPVNESWGVWNIKTDRAEQSFATAMYHYTKSFDRSRPAVCNDGWEHTETDILTIHIYEQDGARLREGYKTLEQAVEGSELQERKPFAEGFRYGGQPIIFSEFGGTALCANTNDGEWGYGNGVKTAHELEEKYAELVGAVKSFAYASGYCYTQLTDVQQEVNGLMKENREIKVNIDAIRKVNEM